jgi:signal transduction histidine kinase
VSRPLSFRSRILGLVLGVAIVPLVLIGIMLLRGAAATGEQVLSRRLERAAEDSRRILVGNWIPLRSLLLDVSEWPEVGDVVGGGPTDPLTARLLELDPRIREVTIGAPAGTPLYAFNRSALAPEEGGLPPAMTPLMNVVFELRNAATAAARIEFGLEGELLLPTETLPTSASGIVIALLDPATGASLLPVPVVAPVPVPRRFSWGDEEWLTESHSFRDPPLTLVLAAPVTPYVAPVRRSVRNGALLLASVAALALLGAIVLTSRMTRSLRGLVEGADAVSAGDLSRRVAYAKEDEFGRVAAAFNQMTESLQETLRERASRESLAAMGEFAASLAHEVRNPLTAVKIDLQGLEERIGDDPALRQPLTRALEEIDRLDATVGDALSFVRRGDGAKTLDIRHPIEAAVRSAAPSFERAGARLEIDAADSELPVAGDPAGLEQLFLNLLLNAAEALSEGGRARIEAGREGGRIRVRVTDDGPGIPGAIRERIFEPLFSTKDTGTGLGLTISRRIVEAHRGTLEVRDAVGGGTRVEVNLPAAETCPKRADSL